MQDHPEHQDGHLIRACMNFAGTADVPYAVQRACPASVWTVSATSVIHGKLGQEEKRTVVMHRND
jgi:hypothetical protein